jgi:serine/threonine protein kinase
VLERKLGEGGMGVVYLARHALLRRKAAIKLLRPDRLSAEARARFEQEAQITSTLTHPNTVEVYDFGRTESGAFYYVMEYLVGIDLQRLAQTFGPLPQARVIHFLRQLCGSLAEAHAAGIVHRDIKPANLFACTRGGQLDTLKVLDFGIVQVERAEPIREGEALAGTPEYMAPELFESAAEASAQSDLYAVGVVAYFLLTGAPPFSGSATRELCMAHLTQVPEPIELPGEPLDPTLGSAIRACLAKQPSARPASAASLAHLLERSAIAGAWTQAEAQTWWSQHGEAVAGLRASQAPGSRRSLVVPMRTPG